MKTTKREGCFSSFLINKPMKPTEVRREWAKRHNGASDLLSKVQEVQKSDVERGSERDRPPAETEGRRDRPDRRTRVSIHQAGSWWMDEQHRLTGCHGNTPPDIFNNFRSALKFPKTSRDGKLCYGVLKLNFMHLNPTQNNCLILMDTLNSGSFIIVHSG